MKRKGVTFIEIMVVITILAFLMIAAVKALNPAELINRAHDAQRKKDLNRMKISFEDYYNDKGCYPNRTMVDSLINKSNCGTDIFLPWLPKWPCDPKSEPYKILIGNDDCPKWYKALAYLEGSSDPQIEQSGLGIGKTISPTDNSNPPNYSVYGGNVPDEIEELNPICWQGGCYYVTTSCNWIKSCSGSNCYSGECIPECKTKSCK
jgi:prepilin-type N-terminal cleavage/methylation domain-containing protein